MDAFPQTSHASFSQGLQPVFLHYLYEKLDLFPCKLDLN